MRKVKNIFIAFVTTLMIVGMVPMPVNAIEDVTENNAIAEESTNNTTKENSTVEEDTNYSTDESQPIVEEPTQDSSTQESQKTPAVLPKATNYSNLKLNYSVHVRNIGWQSQKIDNEIAGTTGQGKRVEAIKIALSNAKEGDGISYEAHVQNIGWQKYVSNGQIGGTTGQSKRIEAVRIKLTGAIADEYSVYYRTHIQNKGWMDWTNDNNKSGSTTYGLRVEAIQIKLVKKGDTPPSNTSNPYLSRKLTYKVQGQYYGWQESKFENEIAGTTGQGSRLEALKLSLNDLDETGNIIYRTHVSNIGWTPYVKNGVISGTVGQSKAVEAVSIALEEDVSAKYDIYYRVHSQTFGWLGWAKNGEDAGSTGQSKRVEAIQIVMVNKGEAAPGSTENHFRENPYELSIKQIDETTSANYKLNNLSNLMSDNVCDSITVTSSLVYNGSTTYQVKKDYKLSDITSAGINIDLGYYGKYHTSLEFKKAGKTVNKTDSIVGISASEYNLAPLDATFPVVYFSLSLWDINSNSAGKDIPTIVMLGRPKAYNWSNLPEGTYGMPYLSNIATTNYTAYAQYVKDLYDINPNSKFHLYINDITCSLINSILYANKIPSTNYDIKMLSDGTATYNFTKDAYSGVNPEAKHQELINTWNSKKQQAISTGKATLSWHEHWDCMYAILSCEENVEWWVSRPALFTCGDNTEFATKIQTDSKVTRVNVNTLLTNLQNKGDATVQTFKKLYNFNDEYFADAEAVKKKVMMLIGSHVMSEANFVDYAKLTRLYYGDDYMYYYKGHPATPTDLYPSKQEELNELGMKDIDSSIAAELILFFYPDINISGYGSTTFQSASDEMACGLFNISKTSALSSGATNYYDGIDWFSTKIDKNTVDSKIKALCPNAGDYYLVELSDAILGEGKYDIGIFDAAKKTLKFYKLVGGEYVLVETKSDNSKISYSAHVANIGWQTAVTEVDIAGTTGQSKALEALKINLTDELKGSVYYRAHVSHIGWQGYKSDGAIAGTTGQSKAIEAIQLKLDADLAKDYDIYYRVHSQTFGWLGWAKNDEMAGTTGLSKSVEAYQIKIVTKGSGAPGSTNNHYLSK